MPNWTTHERYTARVIHVRDGDTLEVLWETTPPYPGEDRKGFSWPDPSVSVIRLAGIDAPEMLPEPEQGAVAAKLALEELVLDAIVEVQATRSWPDRYGRMIANVYVDGANVSHLLLACGLVRRYSPRLERLRAKLLCSKPLPGLGVSDKPVSHAPDEKTATGSPDRGRVGG